MKTTFSYEQASALIPEVKRLTDAAVAELEAFAQQSGDEGETDETSEEYQRIINAWAESINDLGVEVKGLWLVDFDSGSGYYCWKHPEPSLQFFHGYEEGFGGRVPLT
ncbi:MAG TPA: DUF2203 family protein [Thermoanaerobaculia bacterium]|nr:DUF2203 family protein [Thermoanaerobaculia bacterium]